MKQIKVNENCSGCGLCVVSCSYLRENSDGNAEFIAGKSISEDDLDAVKKVISECPQNALKLVDTSSTNKKGKDGVREIIAKLKKECENFSVARVTASDIPFKAKDYLIPVPHSNNEYKRDYNSYNAARSAAKEELDRLCYSQNAYRPMLKKVFVEYKIKYLKPYYTLTDTEDSAYFKYNQQIRELLANAGAEITDLIGDDFLKKLNAGSLDPIETIIANVINRGDMSSNNWKDFFVQLYKKDSFIEGLMCFENRSENSGIISQLKELNSHSLDNYANDISIDSDKLYVGEGMFGKSKFKEKYYFHNFRDAAQHYIDNLTWAIEIQASEIMDGAIDLVNYTLEFFEKRVKEELNKKIAQLEKCLNNVS